jgi:exosortase A-associated hydrolase 2
MTRVRPRVSGQFLRGPNGALAAVLWQPPAGMECTLAVLHVPAFGDEMNKSRRMVALQARALAAQGATVAVLDPSGTGDSAGEFGDATWDAWVGDVRFAWSWLESVARAPRVLWGLRLGALLCADAIAVAGVRPDAALLWQPVLSGRAFFRQLLRLPTAQRMSRSAAADAAAQPGPAEVGGYAFNPSLVATAESRSMEALPILACPVTWLENSITTPAALSPAAAKVVAQWHAGGAKLDASAIRGPSFWSSQEIAEAPELIDASTRALATLFRTSHQSA